MTPPDSREQPDAWLVEQWWDGRMEASTVLQMPKEAIRLRDYQEYDRARAARGEQAWYRFVPLYRHPAPQVDEERERLAKMLEEVAALYDYDTECGDPDCADCRSRRDYLRIARILRGES